MDNYSAVVTAAMENDCPMCSAVQMQNHEAATTYRVAPKWHSFCWTP